MKADELQRLSLFGGTGAAQVAEFLASGMPDRPGPGMDISRRIIDRHDGQIMIDLRPGEPYCG